MTASAINASPKQIAQEASMSLGGNAKVVLQEIAAGNERVFWFGVQAALGPKKTITLIEEMTDQSLPQEKRPKRR